MKIIFFLLISNVLFAQISIQNAWQNVLSKNDGLKASQADITHDRLKQESAEGMYLPLLSLFPALSLFSPVIPAIHGFWDSTRWVQTFPWSSMIMPYSGYRHVSIFF